MHNPLLYKWIDALESGDYSQTSGVLCSASEIPSGGDVYYKFCCLGVLVDVNHPEYFETTPSAANTYGMLASDIDFDAECFDQPRSPLKFLLDEVYSHNDLARSVLPLQSWLAELNDKGFDFRYIASTLRYVANLAEIHGVVLD